MAVSARQHAEGGRGGVCMLPAALSRYVNSNDSEDTSEREENCVQGGWCTLCVRRLTSEKGMPASDQEPNTLAI